VTNATIIDGIVKSVAQICTNIEMGDCPYQIREAYVACEDPNDLQSKGAVMVYVRLYDRLATAECQLIEKLLGSDGIGASDLLARYCNLGCYKDVAAAMSDLVDEVAQSRPDLIPHQEVNRMKSLFSVWMTGVSWEHCFTVSTCGSFNGYPWEDDNIVDRSLYRNISNKNVRVEIIYGNVMSGVATPWKGEYMKIWDENGQVGDPEQATRDAIGIMVMP
jgi:hypothetical protein